MRTVLSLFSILIGIMTLAALVLQKSRTEMSLEFFMLYAVAGLLTVGLGIMTFFADFVVKKSGTKNLIGRSFFIVDKSFLRPLSLFIAIPVVVFLAVSIGVGLLVGSNVTGQADGQIFSPPNPYSASLTYSTGEELAQYGLFTNIFNGAIVPGIFEEGLIFFAWQATTALLLFLVWWLSGFKQWVVENPFLYWGIVLLISLPLWSLAFSAGHGKFEGNNAAYLWAFFFEYFMQFLNAITGFFGSWLPHAVHNAVVISNKTLGLVTASVMFIPRRWLHEPILALGLNRAGRAVSHYWTCVRGIGARVAQRLGIRTNTMAQDRAGGIRLADHDFVRLDFRRFKLTWD